MSKDNLAFRKYGIRPAADWERWHNAHDHFENGSVPAIQQAPEVAQDGADLTKKNADLAVKVANISQKLANGSEGADLAASHARDAVREKDEAAKVANFANVAAARGDHRGAANAALTALDHAQNAGQYAQLAANAAGNAGTPQLVVETTMTKAHDLHEHAEGRKSGVLEALRRYLARIRGAKP